MYLIILYGIFFAISILLLLTGGRKQFLKKKVTVGMMILALTGSMGACASKAYVARPGEITNRWIDRDTLRMTATGKPDEMLTNDEDKKKSAQKNAVIAAQEIMVKYIKEHQLQAISCYVAGNMPEDFEEQALKYAESAVKKGRIVSETYDKNFNSRIIYEIKEKHLRGKCNN
jgi:hypothetical protein